MPEQGGEHHEISVLAFAHIGDAVFELMVRTWLCSNGVSTAKNMHNETVMYVSAKAQAAMAEKILPTLSDEETSVFKRGRNAHPGTTPRSSSFEEYHTATGLETLFGYLYLNGNIDRLDELFDLMVAGGRQNAS